MAIKVKDVYLNAGRFGTSKGQPEIYVVSTLPWRDSLQTAWAHYKPKSEYGSWYVKAGVTSKDELVGEWATLVLGIEMAKIPPLAKVIEEAMGFINELAVIEDSYQAFKSKVLSMPRPDGLDIEFRTFQVYARLKDAPTYYRGFGIAKQDDGSFVADIPDLATVKADLDALKVESDGKKDVTPVEVDAEERSARAKLAQATRHANIELEKLRAEVQGWNLARV